MTSYRARCGACEGGGHEYDMALTTVVDCTQCGGRGYILCDGTGLPSTDNWRTEPERWEIEAHARKHLGDGYWQVQNGSEFPIIKVWWDCSLQARLPGGSYLETYPRQMWRPMDGNGIHKPAKTEPWPVRPEPPKQSPHVWVEDELDLPQYTRY